MLEVEIETKPYLTEQKKGNLNKPHRGSELKKNRKEAASIWNWETEGGKKASHRRVLTMGGTSRPSRRLRALRR
jgi:hypothetical protein